MQFKMAESVETLTLWLAVKVVSRSEVLFGSKIISCSGVETFGGLLSRLEEERFSETNVQKILIQDGKGHNHEVQLDAPLTLCSQFHSMAVTFHLAEVERGAGSSDSSRPNAFQILMSSQRRVELPKKVDTPRADQRMYNDIIDLLASWNIGWSPDTVHTIGKRCVKVLCGALWYLDPHHGHFGDRSLVLPACFEKFQGYNDWKKKKEKRPQLSQAELDRHIQALSSILSQPWSHKPYFNALQSKLVQFVETMKQYLGYLKRHNETMKKMNNAYTQTLKHCIF